MTLLSLSYGHYYETLIIGAGDKSIGIMVGINQSQKTIIFKFEQ